MLNVLHFHLKFSLASIFTLLYAFNPAVHPGAPLSDCKTEQLLIDLQSRSLEHSHQVVFMVPPYDLSTPLQQWRFLGDKNGYANFFMLGDILVFPGSYIANQKWKMSFSYFVQRESSSSANLTLVVSRDQGQTWTPWLDIQPSKPYLQTTNVEFDDPENQGQLFFGLKGSDKHVADLEIEDLDIAPAPSMHNEEHKQMTEGEEVLLTEQEDKLALA